MKTRERTAEKQERETRNRLPKIEGDAKDQKSTRDCIGGVWEEG